MKDGLGPLLRAAVLAYAAVMARPAEVRAQEKPPVAAEKPATLEELEHRLRTSVPQLDADRFVPRQQATKAMLDTVDRALNLRNPLPPDILEIIDPYAEGMTPEQRARLEGIRRHAREAQTLLPGRIACPVQSGVPVSVLLENQFGLPLRTEVAAVEKAVADDREGYEGQTSGDALLHLCNRHGCVPELTPEGIILRPAEGAEVRVNDNLCVVEKGGASTVFHLPDRGTILTGLSRDQDGAVRIADGGFHPWSEGHQTSPDPYLRVRPDGGMIEAIVGMSPVTRELDMEGRSIAEIGPQSFRIMDVTREEDGTWSLTIKGHIYPNLAWPATNVTEDMYTYQLAASARFTVRMEDGQRTLCAAQDLTFTQRCLSLKLRSASKPLSVGVRAYERAEPRRLRLP